MHAQNIFAFLALAVMAMSAAIPAAVPAPNAGTFFTRPGSSNPSLTILLDLVRKGDDKADAVDITDIGDGY